MRIDNFIRFAEAVMPKEEKRVVSITFRPTISDCTGTIYFTDLQLQEGALVTGYTGHTETMCGPPGALHWHNALARDGDVLVIPNMGQTSAPLDIRIYPKQSVEPESVTLLQGGGSHAGTFVEGAAPGDELALLASARACRKNGQPTGKHGFFQYTAAHDSKHPIRLGENKAARVLYEYREAMEGEPRP